MSANQNCVDALNVVLNIEMLKEMDALRKEMAAVRYENASKRMALGSFIRSFKYLTEALRSLPDEFMEDWVYAPDVDKTYPKEWWRRQTLDDVTSVRDGIREVRNGVSAQCEAITSRGKRCKCSINCPFH